MAHGYARYALLRIVQAVVVVLLAYVFTFIVVSILPGDPITNVLRNPENGFSAEQIHHIIAAQGLDKPVLVQLWHSLSHFLIGDLGTSMRTNRPVAALIGEVLPSTLSLAAMALVVAVFLAFTIAYATRVLPKGYAQELARGFPALFLSLPNFVMGLLVIHLFGFTLGLFRVIDPTTFSATLFAAIALGIPISAQLTAILIANLDAEGQREYAIVARSRGLSRTRLFLCHLLKPSSLPVITVLAIAIGELLGGSVITETVFARTGIGSLVQRTVATQDLPVLQAIVSLAAVVFVFFNLLADLVYPLLDPRVSLAGPRTEKSRFGVTGNASLTSS